ncbi:hypothetical protein AVEN_199654-1 [Araneus ventricosus]|uniref:Uncharacterized protein n=1 Tax=Araneus ventricosus TaxID=182803 RepID=A0A4Y2DH95_ARAVE|nr:hypothetical protein AVEN_199654-1 [Araneus ventricosus]
MTLCSKILHQQHTPCFGTAKNLCCSRVSGVTLTLRENVGKFSDTKGSESTDGDLSTGLFRSAMWEYCVWSHSRPEINQQRRRRIAK